MFKHYKWSEVITAYAFLALALLLAVLFVVVPIGKAIDYSFTDYYSAEAARSRIYRIR